ncbi:MAG: hypothetical protein DRN81_02045 [Thermoproteota archaeon]|nr:MAG: hypothetical protein DRN81_02045 [Candidatus Korarchaeota archaeon]
MIAGNLPSGYQVRFLYLNSSNVGANWNWSNECVNLNTTRARVADSDYNVINWTVLDCDPVNERAEFAINLEEELNTTGSIYPLCYGNETATPKEHNNIVIPLYFEGWEDDCAISPWAESVTAGIKTISTTITRGGCSAMLLGVGNGSAAIRSNMTTLNTDGKTFSMDIYFNASASGSNSVSVQGDPSSSETIDQLGLSWSTGSSCVTSRWYDGADHRGSICYPDDVWYTIEARNINFTTGTFDIYVDNILDTAGATTSTRGFESGGINFVDSSSVGFASFYDNIMIRDYDADEANMTFILGAEESGIPPDTTSPTLDFTSPTLSNGTVSSDSWIFINVTADEALDTCLVEWGTVYNQTMTVDGSYCYLNKTNSSGTIDFKVYANDTYGNQNVTESRRVFLDSINPSVTLVDVANSTSLSVPLNFTVDDTIIFTDDFSVDLSQWTIVNGDFNITNGSLLQIGSTPVQENIKTGPFEGVNDINISYKLRGGGSEIFASNVRMFYIDPDIDGAAYIDSQFYYGDSDDWDVTEEHEGSTNLYINDENVSHELDVWTYFKFNLDGTDFKVKHWQGASEPDWQWQGSHSLYGTRETSDISDGYGLYLAEQSLTSGEYIEYDDFLIQSSDVSGTDSCWYSTSDDSTNVTLPGCSNSTVAFTTYGAKTITIWANDTAGNIGSSTITFTLSDPTVIPIDNIPNGLNVVASVAIVAGFLIFLIILFIDSGLNTNLLIYGTIGSIIIISMLSYLLTGA